MVACRSKGCLTFCGLLIIMSVWLFGFMGMVMCYWIDGFDSLGQNHKIGLFSEFVNSTGCNWSSGEDWIEAELLGVVRTCCVLGPICSTMALCVGFVPCVHSSDRRYAVTALLSWISGALGAIGVAIFDVNVNLHSRAERGPGFYLYAIWIVLNVLGGILIFVGGQSCENEDGDLTRSRILTPSLDLQQEQQRLIDTDVEDVMQVQ